MKNRALLLIPYLLCVGIIAVPTYYWAASLACIFVVVLGLVCAFIPRMAAMYCGLFLGLIVGHLVGVVLAILTMIPTSEKMAVISLIMLALAPSFSELIANLVCGACELAGAILGGAIAWQWADEAGFD